MLHFVSLFQNMSSVASIIVSLSMMLFFGFALTRLTKLLRLPDVTGYILAGILIGPFGLDFIPKAIITNMDFLSDIALAFIAFSTGEYFKLSVLKENGMKVVVITVLEACMASVFVFVATFFFLHLSLAFSIVLAALAAATAPASTMMTIRQTGAKGDFVNTLLQVVALDDVVGLLEYSIAISVALASVSQSGNGVSLSNIIHPILLNIGVVVLGCLFGYLLKVLLVLKFTTDNRLIIAICTIFSFCGVSAILDVSPLLGCMSMATVYINLTDDDKLFQQLNYFSPPILLLFFVRSGLSFDLGALVTSSSVIGTVPLLLVGVVYFIVRIAGKYFGSFLGCMIVHKPKEVRDYLGLALIPQAGVAIGLAALGARTLGGVMGNAFQTIILASSVLYELIGPACAKLSLYLSHSYATKLEELVPAENLPKTVAKKSSLDLLIERIATIQKELPRRETGVSVEEQAFSEAAEEQYEAFSTGGRRPHMMRGV